MQPLCYQTMLFIDISAFFFIFGFIQSLQFSQHHHNSVTWISGANALGAIYLVSLPCCSSSSALAPISMPSLFFCLSFSLLLHSLSPYVSTMMRVSALRSLPPAVANRACPRLVRGRSSGAAGARSGRSRGGGAYFQLLSSTCDPAPATSPSEKDALKMFGPVPAPKNFISKPFPYHTTLTLEVDSITPLGMGSCKVQVEGGEWEVQVPYVIPGEIVVARVFRSEFYLFFIFHSLFFIFLEVIIRYPQKRRGIYTSAPPRTTELTSRLPRTPKRNAQTSKTTPRRTLYPS